LQNGIGVSWGCGRRFSRADALGRHFRSEAGRLCIQPLIEEEAAERQKGWLEEQHQAQAAAGLVTPQPMMAAPYYDMTNGFLLAALLREYPALAGLDLSSIPRGFPPGEEVLSRRSSCDASGPGGLDENILPARNWSLWDLPDSVPHILEVEVDQMLETPSEWQPPEHHEAEIARFHMDIEAISDPSPPSVHGHISIDPQLLDLHYTASDSVEATVEKAKVSILPTLDPQFPACSAVIPRSDMTEPYTVFKNTIMDAKYSDAPAGNYIAANKKGSPSSYVNQTTFDPSTRLDHSLLDTAYHGMPHQLLSHPGSLDPTAVTLKNPHDTTFPHMHRKLTNLSLHGLSSAEEGAPQRPSNIGRPRGTSQPPSDDQAVNISSAYDSSNMQPSDSPPTLPTLTPSAYSEVFSAGSGSRKVQAPNGWKSPSASLMSSSTNGIGESTLEVDSSADPHIAPTLVSRAKDDASLIHLQEYKHSRSTDAANFDGAHSQQVRSPDLRDNPDARANVAASTAHKVPEDASTSYTESSSNNYHHREPSQSPCEEDLAASDLDEHGLTKTGVGSSLVRTAASSFGEARAELEWLRLGIDTLEDGSDSSSNTSRNEPDILIDSHYSSQTNGEPNTTGSTNDNEDGSGVQHRDAGGSHIDAGSSSCDTGTLNSTAQVNGRKRQRLNNANDGDARAELSLGEKQSRLACKRFVCCFHKGPGQPCSGTDETISEVLKKLSEQHDTYVCDRCWVLKVKHERSGLFVHPPHVLDCLDHCLSPQCHKTTPTIGHRHEFDPGTCKTKTSRVRPGDSEAVFRFIFSLVHPTLESPAEVVTAQHSLHLGAVPRQGRRKATREELTAQADLLGENLEDLERKYIEATDHTNRLKQELSDVQSTIESDKEKTSSLEAKLRRVIAILGDALRTGEFRDQQGHRSLLMRVGEDAPDALSLLSYPLPSPPESTNGQQPSFMSTREKTNTAAQCQLFQDAYPMNLKSAALDKTLTSQIPAMGINVADQEMDIDWDWLNLLGNSGNTSNALIHTDGF
jgi:hypothetical protein